MNVAHELQDLIAAYLDGRIALEQIRDWLAEHVQALADAGDPEVERLSGRVWILLAEVDYGHLDESSVRHQLFQALAAAHVRYGHFNVSAAEEVQTRSGTDNVRVESAEGSARMPSVTVSWRAGIRHAAASA